MMTAAMRLAVISDIHGNCVALDAAIADLKAQEVDSWICLGDVVQGGPQPGQVIDRLREIGCLVLIGNADAFILEGEVRDDSVEEASDPMKEIRDWTFQAIGDDGIAFVKSFVDTYEIDLGVAGKLFCFHGSPRSFNEVLLPETPVVELREAIGQHDATHTCGGHVHLQWTTQIDGATFFNPGSVGLAYNRHMSEESFYVYPNAEYAVLAVEDDTVRIEFCRVPFDVDALEKAALSSGRPYAEREGQLYRPRS